MNCPPVTAQRQRRLSGFTLLELMVSMSVLAIIMLLVFQMLGATQRGWSQSRARLSTFKEARVAFESMTRRLSQATLNTYYDYEYQPKTGVNRRPIGYKKESELHFVCGPADKLNLTGGNHPGHAIFFQAPIGFSLEEDNQQLTHLMNAWGYFIEFNDGTKYAPGFLDLDIKTRPRFRLMEFRPPSEDLSIYQYDLKDDANKSNIDSWFKDAENGATDALVPYSRPIGENILMLIIEPREPKTTNSSTNQLAPDYTYDSRAAQTSRGKVSKRYAHVLPPIIDVTMVAMDEESAIRYAQINGDMSTLKMDGLFKNTSSYEADLRELEKKLSDARIDYRVFHETVAIKASNFDSDIVLP